MVLRKSTAIHDDQVALPVFRAICTLFIGHVTLNYMVLIVLSILRSLEIKGKSQSHYQPVG